MHPRTSKHFHRIGLSLALSALWLTASFANLGARTLIQNSPFQPPVSDVKQASKPTGLANSNNSQGRFLLKGVSKIGSIYLFSILDKTSGEAKWIESGVRSNGFVITGYDPATQTVDYEWNKQIGTIQLARADEQPIQLHFTSGHASPASSDRRSDHSESSRSTIKGQIASQRAAQTVAPEKIVFEQRSTALSLYSPAARKSGPIEKGYASEDLFADIGVQDKDDINPIAENGTTEGSQRFKVSRKPRVNNANGKKPDHMSFADWFALKESQR